MSNPFFRLTLFHLTLPNNKSQMNHEYKQKASYPNKIGKVFAEKACQEETAFMFFINTKN